MKRIVALVAIVVAVVVLWSLEPGDRGPAAEGSQDALRATVQPLEPPRAKPSSTPATHAPVASPDTLPRTFVRDPAVERKADRAKALGEMAVLTAAGRKELQRLYADEELIHRQSERILRPDPTVDRSAPGQDRAGSYTFAHVSGSLPAEGEAERMDAVRYLSEALRWKQNPSRDLVAEEIERVLLEDSITDALHPGVRRGMMGDKIELYSILAREYPAQADTLSARASSTRVEKLLAMARSYAEAGYTYDGIGRPRDERSAQRGR